MQRNLLTMARLAAVGAVCALGISACGSSSGGGGTGSLSGKVAGTTFAVASEIAIAGPVVSSCSVGGGTTAGGGTFDAGETCSSGGQAIAVLLTNRSDATCSLVLRDIATKTGVRYANFDDLELVVASDSANLATGAYSVVGSLGSQGATSGATAFFKTTTSTCVEGVNAQATSGSITLSQVSPTNVSGTYEVTFGTQGSFTGSFDVSICDLPDGGLGAQPGDGGLPACQP